MALRTRLCPVVAGLVLLGACSGGAGVDGGVSTTVPATTPLTAATATSPNTSTPSTTVVVAEPAGTVSLRVTGLTLPDLRSGGTGLRLVVRATTPRLIVSRRGGGGAVSVCPTDASACVDLAPQATVELASGGVELRATGAGATVDEVAVTYVAATRTTTLVTPSRPAGACAAQPCEATYSLTPGRPGDFTLDGRASGGRARLVLTAVPVAGSALSNRMVATVEGGGILSIRGTLEAGTEASLLHHQQGSEAVAPVTAEILWP